jgi:hypothetical protein
MKKCEPILQAELNASMKSKFDEKFPPQRQRPEGSSPVLMTEAEATNVEKRLNQIMHSDVTIKFRSASGYRCNTHYATPDAEALLAAMGEIVTALLLNGAASSVVEQLNAVFDRFDPEGMEKLVVQTVRRVKD